MTHCSLDLPLHHAATVNQVLARWPATAHVFNSLGIDSCCGGGQTLAAAARDAWLDTDDVIAMLSAAAGPPAMVRPAEDAR